MLSKLRSVSAGPRWSATIAVSLLTAAAAVIGVGVVPASASTSAAGRLQASASTSAAGRLQALLAHGKAVSNRQTVQLGEVLGVSAPGAGEIIRIHSVWNTAQDIQADAETVTIGRLGTNLPAEQVVSTVDVTKGRSTWIKSTRSDARWTYERLPASAHTSAGTPLYDLLSSSSHAKVMLVSSGRSGSRWRISYTASDLQSLSALREQLPKLPALSAEQRTLLSGVGLKVIDFQLSLDALGRVKDAEFDAIQTESRADAKARHTTYPANGVVGDVMLELFYTYGGHFEVTPPPASQVVNPGRPLK